MPDNGSPVAGYRIYATTSADGQGNAVVRTAQSTGATVTGLANGTVYYFRVTAFDAAGKESSFSTPASAEPSAGGGPLVPVPQGLPKQLIAFLLAGVAAGALTLAARYKRLNSDKKNKKNGPPTAASDIRAVSDTSRPPAVSVRDTGREPTRTVCLVPHAGITTTTIKERRP